MVTRLQSQIIVQKPSQLTANWAQNILNNHSNFNLKNTKINNVEITSVDIGTTTRVRLAVDHDGLHDLPKSWFVKLPSLSFRAKAITALPRLLPTEVRFYKELAGHVPLNKPNFRWLAGPIRRLEDGLGTALAVPLMKRGLHLAGDYDRYDYAI